MSLAVVKEHCSVRFDGTNIFIIGGKGDTYHNGKLVPEGTEQKVRKTLMCVFVAVWALLLHHFIIRTFT